MLSKAIRGGLQTMATTTSTTCQGTQRGMATITGVMARQIYDSRGRPTVEVEVTTEDGTFRAGVPSGSRQAPHAAHEVRDGGRAYGGLGVSKAVSNVTGPIAKAVIGMDPTQQAVIDKTMIDLDGTPEKGKLGSNAIVGVSIAVAKAGAAAKKLPLFKHLGDLAGNPGKYILPVPCLNMINGGTHAGNKLAMQESMIMPIGATSFAEAMTMGVDIYHKLSSIIRSKYGPLAINVGNEGGFAPTVHNTEETMDLIVWAIEKTGNANKVKIALDPASSEFRTKDGRYDIDFKNPGGKRIVTGDELTEMYKELIKAYPVILLEDPFGMDDWDHFAGLTAAVGNDVEIVGDDLLVTSSTRVQEGVKKKACNGLILKVNQVGTLTEAIEAAKLAKKNGWGVFTSHRTGETDDSFIADLAVGLCTGHIKAGAPTRSERLAKYNELLRIEEMLGSSAAYAGSNYRNTGAWMGEQQ